MKRIGEIDRRKCRATTLKHISMLSAWHRITLTIYQRLIEEESSTLTVPDGDLSCINGSVTQQYYIAAKSSPSDDRARVLKYGRLFPSSIIWVISKPPDSASRGFSFGVPAIFLNFSFIYGMPVPCL